MSAMRAIQRALPRDPRIFQTAALASLLAFGALGRAFEIAPLHIAAIFAAALATQWLGATLNAIRFEARSALITALSLSLLLRADAAWPLALAAIIAIGSKFTLRLHNKHIFNPANFAIVCMALATDAAWTTPGQWGAAFWFAALLAGAGFFICYRADRLDVPIIFLTAFAVLIIMRAIWLGDPLAIPLLRLQNGALILFAFFMISDPMTTPNGKAARAGFAIFSALIAYLLIYHFHLQDGLFYALAIACIVRPILEAVDPASKFSWPGSESLPQLKRKPIARAPAE